MLIKTENFFLYWAVFSANLLSLSTSTGFSWTSPTIPKLTSNDSSINPLGEPTTTSENTILATLYYVGCILGCVFAGVVSEKIGRKRTLCIISIPFFVCHLMMAFANNIIYLYVARVILGVSGGCTTSALPSYIAEISEDNNRGFFGNAFGILNCFGHLLSFGVGPLVSFKTFSYILMAPVTIFFITFIPFVPETPYYYVSKNNVEKAEDSLRKLRRKSNVQNELLKVKSAVEEDKRIKLTWRDLTEPSTKHGLLVAASLLVFQQALGVPFVQLYLQPILEASGNIIPSDLASVSIGFVQLIACIVSTFLIDRIGRKILLYISATGCSLSLFFIGSYFLLESLDYDVSPIFWLPFVSLVGFNIFFNLGYVTIPHSIGGELFNTNVKSFCVSFATCLNILTGIIVGGCFPFMADSIGMGQTFLIFSAIAALTNVFVIFLVPETKGRSFTEIQSILGKSGKSP